MTGWLPDGLAGWLSYAPADFLMFSGQTYWRLFALGNAALWPLPVLAPLLGAGTVALAAWRPRAGLRLLAGLLGLAWASVGWFFVWQAYAPIHLGMGYAAPLFAAEALLLGVAAAAARPAGPAGPARPRGAASAAGFALLLWGVLLHPLATLAAGRPLAQAEVAGIAPDPTAIATLGLALLLPRGWLRLALLPVPALWLAQSAATLGTLGAAEWVLPAAALLAAFGALAAARLRRRPR